MNKKSVSYSRQLAQPVTLLSVSDGKSENVATMAWVMPVSSNPPLLTVAVSPRRHSHDLVLAAGEFAVLVLTDQQKNLSTLAGTISGRNQQKWELPEFKGLRREADIIKAPLIRDCRAVYECRLVNHVTAGDHTLFIGEILRAEADDSKNPLILFDRRYIGPGEVIARYP